MESISLEQREVLCDTLTQIKESILNLKKWNEGIIANLTSYLEINY